MLLAETRSVAQVSVETVAARAGVAKTTVYRRWPNKVSLIIEALNRLHPELVQDLPHVSVRDDLVAVLQSLQCFTDASLAGRLFKCILAEEEHHPDLVAAYHEQIVEPRRQQIREVLRRGIETGELRPDADIEIALQCMTWLQARLKLDARPATTDVIERTVDLILGGIAALR
jgi:AcrR family transcriptional regulator